MKLYHAHSKMVLVFKNKAQSFLSAYTTNTLDRPRNAFVDIHGKIVAVFDQIAHSPEEVSVILEASAVDKLLTHLKKYLDLSQTTVEKEDTKVYFDLEKGTAPILSKESLSASATEEEFTLFRLKNFVPLQGIDYQDELLLNVFGDDTVSYTKGCYLGQEIIARVHYRSKPPKKLSVRYEEDCLPDQKSRLTSKTKDPSNGKILGFIFEENT